MFICVTSILLLYSAVLVSEALIEPVG